MEAIPDTEDLSKLVTEKVKKSDGSTELRTYKRLRLLGKGGFARVYEFQCMNTNKRFAAKQISKSDLKHKKKCERIISEIEIHKSISHKNIVRLMHVFEDSKHIYMLLELCENDTLKELLKRRKRLSEEETKSIIYQIILGLAHLHSLNLIHRDLKLANIFLDANMNVKIGDFGFAAPLERGHERRFTVCGTPNYMAPEVLNGLSGYAFEADIWSLGVLTYALVVGNPPFADPSVKVICENIHNRNYSFPPEIEVSEPLKKLIDSIFNIDPTQRPKLQEIQNVFSGFSFPKTLPVLCLTTCLPSDYLNKPRRVVLCSRFENGNYARKWVKKWIDYSSKYGLIYLFSDNKVGIYFNDSTRILLDGNHLLYTFKPTMSKTEETSKYSVTKFPEEITRKVQLLLYFNQKLHKSQSSRVDDTNLLEKWVKFDNGYLFMFSDQTVQLFFNDLSEIILDSKTKQIIKIDAHGVVSIEQLKTDANTSRRKNPKSFK